MNDHIRHGKGPPRMKRERMRAKGVGSKGFRKGGENAESWKSRQKLEVKKMCEFSSRSWGISQHAFADLLPTDLLASRGRKRWRKRGVPILL